jgi:acyl carrier protein
MLIINFEKNLTFFFNYIIVIDIRGIFEGRCELMDSENELFEKVKGIIVEQLGANAEAVKLDASFIDDLGADSLDIVELIMALEDELEMEIPDEEAETFVTVADIVKFMKEHGEE